MNLASVGCGFFFFILSNSPVFKGEEHCEKSKNLHFLFFSGIVYARPSREKNDTNLAVNLRLNWDTILL